MTEYIEREEYCEKHCRCSNEYCDKESCPIWKAPTVDAVPVVRCKDCKRRTQSGHCKMCRHSDGSMRYALDDEFCSMGAKINGGTGNG